MKKEVNKTTIFYPVPVAMVSCGNYNNLEKNIITVSWTGIINTEPPMLYISIRQNRHSYDIIKREGEFIINIVTEELAFLADYCGTNSGKNVDKFLETKLTAEKAINLNCPLIKESPVNIECKVKETIDLGTHTMFMANIVSVIAEEEYIKNNAIDIEKIKSICYNNREYYSLGGSIGKFGYSFNSQNEPK